MNEPTISRVYECRDDLIKALRKIGWSLNEINEALKHEDAHMEEAVRRGYKSKYLLGIIEDVGANKYRTGIALDTKVSEEDLVAILSAPDKLSDSDKHRLKLLRANQK